LDIILIVMVEMPLHDDERIERHSDAWIGTTIVECVEEAASNHPDRTVAVAPNGSLTYDELDRYSDSVATALHSFGIGKGDIVSQMTLNLKELVVVRVAASKLGAVTHFIPPTYRLGDISSMIAEAEPAGFCVATEYLGHDYVSMLDESAFDGEIFAIETEGKTVDEYAIDNPVTRFADLTDHDADPSVFEPLGPNEASMLSYTSGTTGDPKGVIFTENTFLTNMNLLCERFEFDETSTMFAPTTVGHGIGFGAGLVMPLLQGAKTVFTDGINWDPEVAVEMMAENEATHIFCVATILYDIIDTVKTSGESLPSLETVIAGGSEIPSSLVAQANEVLEDTQLATVYGLTEGGVISGGPPGERLDTDGKLLGQELGQEIKLVAPEDEYPGEEGHVLVKGPLLMAGYYDGPERTAASMQDGWFETGDVGKLEDGFLTITGRKKDLIIRGGENVPVAKLEDRLQDHPAVAAVAVVGIPDERLQERVVAFVVPSGEEKLLFTDMQNYLDEQGVNKRFQPEQLQIVSELPRTPAGKMQKYKLIEELADMHGLSS
jgi:acyl-CoA synthetase (AMP-forming)/AMP-acid ligase II